MLIVWKKNYNISFYLKNWYGNILDLKKFYGKERFELF